MTDDAEKASQLKPGEWKVMEPEPRYDPMFIWDDVEKTDAAFTKPFEVGGYKGTSANPTWLYKQATRMFGPAGIGWGYEVLSQEFTDGAPIMAVIKGVDTPLVEKLHTARVRVWYKINPNDVPMHLRGLGREEDPVDGQVFGVGHTPYMYISNAGKVITDKEYEKKSITDAVTKALSLLGFGGDIRMGMYEMADYVREIKDEALIAGAEDQAVEKLRQLAEFSEWYDKNIKLMSTAGNMRELEALFKGGKDRVAKQGDKIQVDMWESTKQARGRAIVLVQREKEAELKKNEAKEAKAS